MNRTTAYSGVVIVAMIAGMAATIGGLAGIALWVITGCVLLGFWIWRVE